MTPATRSKTYFSVLVILGSTHLLNDLMQSLIPASYPILKESYGLDFIQVGLITFTFQIAGALLQPIIGMATDRYPAPYSPVAGMMFTLSGLVNLAFAQTYEMILISVALIGIGSSIFHPEATRMARYAAGSQQGLAQGIFQVGGQAGGALGPVFAALVIVPWGQPSLAWFAVLALLASIFLIWIGSKQREISAEFLNMLTDRKSAFGEAVHPPVTIGIGLAVLTFLMFSKNLYGESFRSFYTFYLIERFELSIPASQMMLFVFLISATLGVLIGGIIGDRIGRYRIIWISILGPLPLTLVLPYADLFLDRHAYDHDQPNHGQCIRINLDLRDRSFAQSDRINWRAILRIKLWTWRRSSWFSWDACGKLRCRGGISYLFFHSTCWTSYLDLASD